MFIDKWGIEFHRKGDAIIWIWPWLRGGERKGRKYSVITLGYTYFNTLKEIDDFWKEYWAACEKKRIESLAEPDETCFF